MPDYELITGLYLAPTPAGAYYAVSSPNEEICRRILLNLMAEEVSPALTLPNLFQLSKGDSEHALEYLYRMQTLNLVQGLREPSRVPSGKLEQLLVDILASLAGRNKILLADDQGFCLASHGFHHESAEELAGLSADLSNLHQRHQGLLIGNLSLQTSAWALVNAGGNSEIGFWPLYIGKQRFVLIMTGLPNLNKIAIVDLIWLLSRRYGQ